MSEPTLVMDNLRAREKIRLERFMFGSNNKLFFQPGQEAFEAVSQARVRRVKHGKLQITRAVKFMSKMIWYSFLEAVCWYIVLSPIIRFILLFVPLPSWMLPIASTAYTTRFYHLYFLLLISCVTFPPFFSLTSYDLNEALTYTHIHSLMTLPFLGLGFKKLFVQLYHRRNLKLRVDLNFSINPHVVFQDENAKMYLSFAGAIFMPPIIMLLTYPFFALYFAVMVSLKAYYPIILSGLTVSAFFQVDIETYAKRILRQRLNRLWNMSLPYEASLWESLNAAVHLIDAEVLLVR